MANINEVYWGTYLSRHDPKILNRMYKEYLDEWNEVVSLPYHKNRIKELRKVNNI